MELRNYLLLLWRQRLIIVVTALLTATVAAAGASLLPTRYAATATLRVATGDGRQVGWDDMQYTDRVMNTAINVAESRPVVDELKQRLGIVKAPKIKAEILANTELIRLTITHPDPAIARDGANTLAEMLILQSRASNRRINAFSLIEPATLPLTPSLPGPALLGALGAAVGLIGGVALAFLFYNLDTRLYTSAQIEESTTLTTLGQIPAARQRKTVILDQGDAAQQEAFRRLRTNMLMFGRDDPQQLIMITSAEPQEGKSTIVANLAYSLTQLGRKVVVVDADMRLPTQHAIFGVDNSVGLSNLLREEVDLDAAIQNTRFAGLQVITSGPRPCHPAEALSSPQMVALSTLLRQRYEIVLLDTPALLAVTDATVLAPLVDSVLLVVGRAQTHELDLQVAYKQLVGVKARLAGVVVNRAEENRAYEYYWGG